MTSDQATTALKDRGVPLKGTSKEDRTYRLIFAPAARKFLVGVMAQDGSTAVTFLEQSQYESDRGKLRAEDLRLSAMRALSTEEAHDWSSTFDWAAQRHDRKDLAIRARYRMSDGHEHEVTVPVGFPLQNEILAGGNLPKALEVDGFVARVNVDLYAALRDNAPQALSNLTSLHIVYGPHPVLDMLAIGGPQLLSGLQNRRVTRSALSMVVTFIGGDGRPFQSQKSRPPIPAPFMFEEMLPHLRTNREFLAFVRDHVAKQVEPHELLSAIAGITELQIGVDGHYIDLITPPDDFEAVNIMLELT